jgi:cysteine synthase
MIQVGIFLDRVIRPISRLLAIIMPDDVAQEKVNALQALGADVQRVRPASIVDKKQVRAHITITIFFLNRTGMVIAVCGEQYL